MEKIEFESPSYGDCSDLHICAPLSHDARRAVDVRKPNVHTIHTWREGAGWTLDSVNTPANRDSTILIYGKACVRIPCFVEGLGSKAAREYQERFVARHASTIPLTRCANGGAWMSKVRARLGVQYAATRRGQAPRAS